MRQAQIEDVDAHPLFLSSLTPMLVVDDQRRCLDANPVACLFLRLSQQMLRNVRLDDLTYPPLRPRLDAMWSEFAAIGRQGRFHRSARWNLQMPDGPCVPVTLSWAPDCRCGLHVPLTLMPVVADLKRGPVTLSGRPAGLGRPAVGLVLSARERQVLTWVARGETGARIAARMFLSRATVETHVTNALIKLGAKNRAHGVAIGLCSGELDLSGTDPDPTNTMALL